MNRVILWDALERIQFLEGWDIDSPQCSQSVGNWMLIKGKFRCFFQPRSHKCVHPDDAEVRTHHL